MYGVHLAHKIGDLVRIKKWHPDGQTKWGLGIITQIHYTPLYRHPYFAKLVGNLRLPGAEEYFAGCLSIPLFPTLTQIDQDKVISELARFLSKH